MEGYCDNARTPRRSEGLCNARKDTATLGRMLLRSEGCCYSREVAATVGRMLLHSKDACDARTLSVNPLDSSLDAANALGQVRNRARMIKGIRLGWSGELVSNGLGSSSRMVKGVRLFLGRCKLTRIIKRR